MAGVDAYPLCWPVGWPRTAPEKQDSGYRFRQNRTDGYGKALVTFAVARDKLYDELQRLGATGVVLSTNHPTDRYGIPVESKKRVGDEGAAVYFNLAGKQMVMACDRFDNAAANMRSLGLAIEALRQLERHGGGTMLERAFTGFEALPAPGQHAKRQWWQVLGVNQNATPDEIKTAYRRQAMACHPDHGGNEALMAEVNAVYNEATRAA
jgi:DnaJ domain